MKMVSIQDLKRHLSSLVAEASAGEVVVITRHSRAVATLSSFDSGHLHVGRRARAGALLKPLLHRATKGRYLAVLDDDRRGGSDR